MFAIRNSTRYSADAIVMSDKDGRDVVVVVAKGTFQLGPSCAVSLAEQQVPLVLADEFYGEPDKSSIKTPSDFALFKPTTDVLVVGFARAPRGTQVTQLDLEVRVGPVSKRVRVFGNRKWQGRLRSLVPGALEPFAEIPLTFERAFGGKYAVEGRETLEDQEDRNPVGVGFWSSAAQASDQALPNMEDPAAVISRWNDRPAPQGFSAICAHWLPRRQYAGTYDEEWLSDRMPLLPEDFDYRFCNVAPHDLQSPQYLVGGESVFLRGFSSQGELSWRLPKDEISVQLLYPMDVVETHRAALDTVIIEPSARRFQMVWRAKLAAPVPLTRLLHIEIRSQSNPAAPT